MYTSNLTHTLCIDKLLKHSNSMAVFLCCKTVYVNEKEFIEWGVLETTIDINFKYEEKEYARAVKWYYLKLSRIAIDFFIAVIQA